MVSTQFARKLDWVSFAKSRATWVALTAAFALAAGLIAQPVLAQNKYRKQLEELRSQVENLESHEQAEAVSDDLKRANQTLEDAEVLLAEGKVNEASWRLKRSEELIVLIEQRLELASLKAKEKQREKMLQRYKEETIPTLETNIKDLKNQKEELQQKLSDS